MAYRTEKTISEQNTMLGFITTNENKFREVKSLIFEIRQLVMDLPEIQEIDPHAVIREKLRVAFERFPGGHFMVEDTSLSLKALGGLPGPFVKWFEQSIGLKGIYELAYLKGDTEAIARTTIGYADHRGGLHFFDGEVLGDVVAPVGSLDFGWGPIFRPRGSERTFGQMTGEEKAAVSMRHKAVRKLLGFLQNA